ncbi:MAG: matrixin family metalloprotease [Actinomycetota bacterium]
MRTRTRVLRASVLVGLLGLGLFTAQLSATAATNYVQPVWFTWLKSTLDVLIVPPEHGQIYNNYGALGGSSGGVNELTPYQNTYLRATEESANDWKQAINTYGASWLSSGLTINNYVVGRDNIPQSALTNPEIVVTSDQNKGPILGVSFRTNPCIVDNSKFFITSFTEMDMYNISAHEYGHCLGLDHSYGTPDDSIITHDVIYATYSDNPGSVGTHKHCMSNLNVKGLERVFGGLFGQPSGGSITMASTSYSRIVC